MKGELKPEECEQGEVDGMNKEAGYTGKLMHIESSW